jgi:tetratricopeptide (TPR) repeat protein
MPPIITEIYARRGFDGLRRASYFVRMIIKRTSISAATVSLAIAAAFAVGAARAAEPQLPRLEAPAEPKSEAPERARPRELPSWGRAPAPPKAPPAGPNASPPDKGAAADGKAVPPPAAAGKPGKAGVKAAEKQAEPEDTPAQRRRSLDDLYAHLATIESAESSAPLVLAIERLWLYTGSDTIDVLMERVLKAVGDERLELAAKLADAIVEMAPRFAEGWNRRALVAYLRNDYAEALNSLHRALALEPNHFKALDGVAQIMRETGEKKAALDAYRKLLDVHPYWSGATEAIEELKREIEGQGI